MDRAEALKLAMAKVARAERLQNEADDLLEPLNKEAIARPGWEHLDALVEMMPPSFHRSELRTVAIKRRRVEAPE